MGSLIFVEACRIFFSCSTWDLVPQPGLNPGPLHRELRIFAIGPPAKSSIWLSQSHVYVWISGQTTKTKKVELDRNKIHKTRSRNGINWPVKIDLGTSHIHSWVLFLLWLHPFILSGVISPLISSSILGTYRPGEFIFQCPIFLPFHTVHGVLKARILKWFAIPFSSGPHSVRPLHHDSSVLGGPTWMA